MPTVKVFQLAARLRRDGDEQSGVVAVRPRDAES